MYEKNRQDIKTLRKRLFVRIFWKIPAKQASKSLVNQGFLTGWGRNDVELGRALTQVYERLLPTWEIPVEMTWSSEEH